MVGVAFYRKIPSLLTALFVNRTLRTDSNGGFLSKYSVTFLAVYR
jgi:arginine/ornithine N-succinyltransferase beta subunit